jgi:hypothetical protein
MQAFTSHNHLLHSILSSQAHLDPTEIIAVPIPLFRLENFVGFAALVLFIVSVPWWELVVLVNTLKTLGITTFAILGMAILCGAHPLHNLLYTVLASFYVASLVSLNPPVFNDATRTTNNTQLLLFTRRIDALTRGDDVIQSFRLYTTLLTMIPFQILNILDSGLQVQRWPLPMLLGSTVGWILGSVLGLLWTFCYTTHNNKSNATTTTSSSGQVDSDEKKDRYYR